MLENQSIAIIGAGLCGSLLGLSLSKRGYNVTVFEKRQDPRTKEMESGRSINLALSDRGLQALDKLGLAEQARAICIPMKGRMIHDIEGKKRFSRYSGREEDYINSISRTDLNRLLIEKLDESENVFIYFETDVKNINLDNNIVHFIANEGDESKTFDFIIGADGAGSIVRRTMDKELQDFQSSSSFLSHGYKELEIPHDNGDYRIDKHSLHIWPRQKFMIIALPNMDGSFTVTMFNPYESETGFNELDEKQEVELYFEKYFKDLRTLLPDLQKDYNENPVGRLGTVKCFPWHHRGKVLLIGDAAHAIVPFYGQGMNASFEDVFVFDELLNTYEGENWLEFCEQFQEKRKKNCDAIADLALDNFIEMQDKVDDKAFIEKRKLEMKLEQEADGYYSKYSLVTFREDLSYEQAMNQGRKQDEILLELCSSESYKFPQNKQELQEILDYVKDKING